MNSSCTSHERDRSITPPLYFKQRQWPWKVLIRVLHQTQRTLHVIARLFSDILKLFFNIFLGVTLNKFVPPPPPKLIFDFNILHFVYCSAGDTLVEKPPWVDWLIGVFGVFGVIGIIGIIAVILCRRKKKVKWVLLYMKLQITVNNVYKFLCADSEMFAVWFSFQEAVYRPAGVSRTQNFPGWGGDSGRNWVSFNFNVNFNTHESTLYVWNRKMFFSAAAFQHDVYPFLKSVFKLDLHFGFKYTSVKFVTASCSVIVVHIQYNPRYKRPGHTHTHTQKHTHTHRNTQIHKVKTIAASLWWQVNVLFSWAAPETKWTANKWTYLLHWR